MVPQRSLRPSQQNVLNQFNLRLSIFKHVTKLNIVHIRYGIYNLKVQSDIYYTKRPSPLLECGDLDGNSTNQYHL